MAKSIIEIIGRERALKLMSDATAKAAEESQKMELPKAVRINNGWYRKYPNGLVSPIIISIIEP